jgi:2-polyprenyl-3-methyl-5-hydroxy-6-metoxy-1,4-benzoquinol methylase
VFWVERMSRRVFRCRSCSHIAVPDGVVRRPDGLSIYESEDSIFESDGNQDYYFDDTNADAARAKLDYVSKRCEPGGRLLDVGASYGHFVATAAQRYDAMGVEVSPGAVEYARSVLGAAVHVGNVYELPAEFTGAFDAVTFWDVIEHLEDPARAIRQLRQCLRPNGLLFLSTPDAGSVVARSMGRRWHYLDPIQHINLFSERNLVRLLRANGFAAVDSRHFGRSYRVSYIVNRLTYLALGHVSSRARSLAEKLGHATVPIKLWDVMGLTARRVESEGAGR